MPNMLHKKIKKIPRTEDRQNIIQEIPDESVHQKYQNFEHIIIDNVIVNVPYGADILEKLLEQII